ncbi:translational activator family protein [Naegleria gruberi]|uniref:Translational activator family protein n=1 Tax=Naegleria gruberi TaxID=5762 RepID=D2VN42_NAEGR|nr:translational activator family protein [Naegleria gruberi]EFC41930.1 translational activator family protein [Naegleria gruberi]|eukprot:XP_002674674.1 translational activator family protein [Naegleria gruberi strain NEG-M]
MINYYNNNTSDNFIIEQILLDSFSQSFIIELENEFNKKKLQDDDFNTTTSTTNTTTSNITTNNNKLYTHSSLRFAIETFRDCLNIKCQDKTSIYKLFILMHHPLIVDNIHSLVHNEKYKQYILNNTISHKYEEMTIYLLNELVNNSTFNRKAISYSIISLILFKHSKHSTRIFELISKELHSHYYLLFESDDYNLTDFIVYNRNNLEEPYHDLDTEVNKHPIFRQSNSIPFMNEKETIKYYRYHLTDKEWEVIQNKEKTIKKNLQESRKQFVKENMLKKENIVKQSIQKQVDKIQHLLSLINDITLLTNGDKVSIDIITTSSLDDDNTSISNISEHSHITSNTTSSNTTSSNTTTSNTTTSNTSNDKVEEHHIRTHYIKFAWSLLLFNVTSLLDKYKYFAPISSQAFNILKNVNRNTLVHLDFANDSQPKTTSRRKNTVSNECIAEMLAIATFRIKNMFNNESGEYEDKLTRYIPTHDNNVTFGDYIIHKIRLQFPNMLESEEFTCLLPLLESILNRQSIISKPEHRFESSSLTTCMSILSAHAGKSDLTSLIRNKVMEICVNEVLPFIPHLNKQGFNSMMSMSPYLIDEFKSMIHSIMYSEMENVRLYCLKTLCQYLTKGDLKKLSLNTLDDIKFILYYSQFDTSEECKVLSKPFIQKEQFKSNLNQVIEKSIPLITCETKYDSYYSRNNSCLTITGALKELIGSDTNISMKKGDSNSLLVQSILNRVIKTFKEKQLKLENEKSFEPLITISWLLQEISPFTKYELKLLFDFIVNDGFRLIETNLESCYQELLDEMVNIGLALVYNHGKHDANLLIELFDGYINQLQKTSNDFATATVVVWYGSVSKYFNAQTHIQKIKKAIDQLIDTLIIPSNSVQKSISEALSPLIQNIYEKEQDYIHNDLINKRLLSFLLYGTTTLSNGKNIPNNYGVKRGFAWGLAGVLYGCGLLDLYQYGISPMNQYLTNNKADKKGKEGCMLALECISHRFQNTFEPYIVEVMPVILNYALSDPTKEVRSSAEQAVSSILSQLTPYGVIQLLPSVIQPTSNDNWRQKAANIKLLGHMAYCAPRQLSSYLPTIIKILKEAVNETHPDIVEASKRSLERVGGASRSPEISKQVPLLLDALTNPDQKTIDKVLESLLFTRFTHSIDSASLALLMPVLTRALTERYTDIKKKACQIIGSISALILDPKRDLFPYMVDLIPILKNILMDPNPQVRASSAKAIGQLCKSVGEDNLSGVMSWLHEKLIQQGDEYVTERSGAAQALCEVISAQGVSRLQKSLPFLLSQIEGDSVQEGYMQVFVYLPALMKSQFEPFLEMCLPRILKALSHSKEGIRETSLQSSRVIVELFTDSAMNILVPALREGLESEEWRTRYNCLILLTDLLTRMTTLYGNSDEMSHLDENPIQLTVIERVLSLELVSHIIALTFIAIQDINLKSIANKLWKDMIANTPSTLKNHLTCITDCILKHLNMSEDQRFIAGKALGELVVKLGERVVGELIPMLHQQLLDIDSNPEKRQGVILGVTELMLAASDKHLQTYSIKLIQIVKRGICDDDSTVRDAASSAFDVLCRVMGDRCVKEIVQQLLQDLEKTTNEKLVEIAASGMQQLVRVRPQNVLPKLIPALLSTHSSSNGLLTDTQLRTLGDVCESVYENDHLDEMTEFILPMIEKLVTQLSISPYIDSVTNVADESILILRTITKVLECLNIQESYTIFELIKSQMTSNDIKVRRAANLFMQMMFNPSQYNEENLTEDFINDELLPIYEDLITSFNDPDDNVVKCAWYAVEKLISKCLSKEVHYNDFIQPTRENIRKLTQVSSTGELISIDLPAFNKIPKGIEPILNLYLHGLLFGKTPESRENSALGIGDLICMTSSKQLSPYVIKITGPLIRVAGDRFPWSVKAAILQTCSSLMDKGSIMLKPFLPQLQATFIKGLQDSSASILRKLSEQSIPKLIDLGCRIDSLVSALNVALKSNALSGKGSVNDFVISITRTLTSILTLACDQDKVKGVPFDQCIDTLKKTLALCDSTECANSILSKQAVQQDSDRILDITSQCLAICSRGLYLQKDNSIIDFINQTISQPDNLYVTFIVMAYWSIDKSLSSLVLDKVLSKIIEISQTIQSTPQFAKIAISLTKAATLIVISNNECAIDLLPIIKSQFEKAATSTANALRYEVAKCVKKLIKSYREKYQTEKMFDFVDSLLQIGIKDKFIPAKLCNERSLFYVLGFADNDHLRSISEYCSFKKLNPKDSKFIEDYGAKVLMKLSPEDSDLEAEEEEEERFYE